MELRPLDDRVVIKPSEAQDKTAGGIFLPDTAKDNKLYLHVFNWPADGKLVVPMTGVKAKATKAYLLADKKRAALAVSGNQDKMTISVPNAAPDSIDSVIVLVTNNK